MPALGAGIHEFSSFARILSRPHSHDRMDTPAEVAGVIFQLCGPDFAYVTGTEVFLTGGQYLL